MPTKRFENIDPERKKKILDEARLEFIRNGYDRASLNTIIREAGISKGSLYYYFEDKIDLYITVLKYETGQILNKIGGIGTGEFTDDFWEDIENYYKYLIRFFSENPDFLRLTHGISRFSAIVYNNESFKELYDFGLNKMIEILKRGCDLGKVRSDIPIELLANILIKVDETLDFWMLEKWEKLTPEEIEQSVATYIDLFKRIASTETAKGVAV